MRRSHFWLLLVAVGAIVPSVARADAVLLKTGGELRGERVASETGQNYIIRTLSGAQVVVTQDDVESFTKRRLALEVYETRRRETPDTVEAHWELAEWCKAEFLRPERERHLKRVIELEPDHKLAHQQLGHVFHDGAWTTRDEIMRNRGYVKYKGRYMLPQELELVMQQEKESEAEKGWYKRINLWHDWMEGDRAERQQEGYKNLVAINDPNAIPALYKAFSADPVEDQRLMYVSIITQIGGLKSVGPLVLQSLNDASDDVRIQAVKGLPDDQYSEAVPVYLRALKHDLNYIVNRAAVALGIIGDESTVSGLIEALITRHRYKTWVPDQQGFGVAMNQNGQVVQQTPINMLPPDIAVMALTGQLPYGVQVNQVGGVPPRKKQVVIQRDEQNSMVHAALRKLTGQDYGYDERAWKGWWNASRSGTRLTP